MISIKLNIQNGRIEVAIYTIRIESVFVLTQKQVKTALGHGYKISSVELEKEERQPPITTVDTAVDSIVQEGYRALARAYHPDLGGSTETMMILNRAKKELRQLLEETR